MSKTSVPTFQSVVDIVKAWCEEHNIPPDHGYIHYMEVLNHSLNAMAVDETLPADTCADIALAAFLHDVDDRKLLKEAPPLLSDGLPYPNARSMLAQAGLSDRIENVVEMISLVSASVNGNTSTRLPHLAIPRDCDRLTAIGHVGIERCEAYSLRVKQPFLTATTPLPLTHSELTDVMADRSLEEYVASGGKSASMLDHFYDKLLHMGVHSQNRYILAENQSRMNYMRDWLLSTNATITTMKKFHML
jgi:uncharacterized protein